MAVIAMTREMATLGKDVATGLAERLGLKIVHHELVEHDVAQHSGLPESKVHRFLEGEASLFERWKIDPSRLSRYTAHEILELAAQGNVLIRGWGATYLLRAVPHVICVRICAPMSFRTRVLMGRLGITDPLLAQREIERNDGAHHAVIQGLFGEDWRNATLYAIILSTSRVSVEQCVEQIARLAESPAFKETTESRNALIDQVILSRVRLALDRCLGSELATEVGFNATVTEGKVTLTGATCDTRLIVEAVRAVHAVPGVKGIESRVTHIEFRPSI